MKKQLVHEFKDKLAEANNTLAVMTKDLEEFKKEFNSLPPVGQLIKTNADLRSAVSDPLKHVQDYVLKQIPDYEFGLPVLKMERLKSLKMPDVAKVNTIAKRINGIADQKSIHIESVFEIQGDKIKVNEEGKEKFLDRFRVFVNDEVQAGFLEKTKQFQDSFNSLSDYLKKYFPSQVNIVDLQSFDIRIFFTNEGLNYQFIEHVFKQKG